MSPTRYLLALASLAFIIAASSFLWKKMQKPATAPEIIVPSSVENQPENQENTSDPAATAPAQMSGSNFVLEAPTITIQEESEANTAPTSVSDEPIPLTP